MINAVCVKFKGFKNFVKSLTGKDFQEYLINRWKDKYVFSLKYFYYFSIFASKYSFLNILVNVNTLFPEIFKII
jgi:hypothetical protein